MSQQSGQLPILDAARYSWQFAMTAFLPTLPAYLVRALVTGAVIAATLSSLSEGAFPLDFIGNVLGLFISISCLAMTLRLAMKGEFDGFTGLKFGVEEARLLLANLMYFLVLFVLGFVAIVLGSIFVGIIMASVAPDLDAMATNQEAAQQYMIEFFGTPAGVVVAILMIAVVAFPLLYSPPRLINFPAATLARQKIMMFETWSWTKDQVWRVVAAIVVTMAPVSVISLLGIWIASSLTGMPLFGSPEDIAAVSPLSGFVYGALAGVFSIPTYLCGAALSVYMFKGFDPQR